METVWGKNKGKLASDIPIESMPHLNRDQKSTRPDREKKIRDPQHIPYVREDFSTVVAIYGIGR
jgi:hypothetical protein